ncbi:FIST N-terminal domain-containing protein [Leptolyngbya sp. 'hensonii']|uniref:FIST signal transduction protein n=1 Tax=Leptolyngbya sp. 'hensonii' TaxID=1922337 RepID=UPI003415AD01
MQDSTYDRMKWANAISRRPSLEAAVSEVIEQAEQALKVPADLALVFISSAFASDYPRLMPLLREKLAVPHLLGCGGGGVIGMSQGQAEEVEGEPALSLSLAYLPGVQIRTFHVSTEVLPDLDSPPNAWTDLIGVPQSENPHFILLADPFSFKVNDLIQGLDFAYPAAVKIGGLSSTGALGGSNGLFCDYRFYREGTVGVALSGDIILEAIVAQGCRPIGDPYRVTAGEQNVMLELEEQDAGAGGSKTRTPLEVLQKLIQGLSEEERSLAQHSLFIGVARNEFKQQLEPGDFLIRNLLGVDPRVGAIAIGDRVRPGQRIQFHLRDAKASADDLETLLKRYRDQAQSGKSGAVGALMFSCLGRGEGLYGEPNFDSRLFNHYLGSLPLSGFFCNGEIGPIGDSTFLHGYTSVFGICRQP